MQVAVYDFKQTDETGRVIETGLAWDIFCNGQDTLTFWSSFSSDRVRILSRPQPVIDTNAVAIPFASYALKDGGQIIFTRRSIEEWEM